MKKIAWIWVLALNACGSASFESAGVELEEDAGQDVLEEPEADAGQDVLEEPEADVPVEVPSCEHQPFVGSDDPCGPGDTPTKSCEEVSRTICHRCTHGGQKSDCAAVVHVGASPSAPGDSWWCC